MGNNGVGKTTLLNRIASREVSNFPMDIKVLYIQHEVLPALLRPAPSASAQVRPLLLACTRACPPPPPFPVLTGQVSSLPSY